MDKIIAKIYPKDKDMSNRLFVRIHTRTNGQRIQSTLCIPAAPTAQERFDIAQSLISDFKSPESIAKKSKHLPIFRTAFEMLSEMRPRIRLKTHLSYRNTWVTFESYCKNMNIIKYSNEIAIHFLVERSFYYHKD